jgi:hypothetical protein
MWYIILNNQKVYMTEDVDMTADEFANMLYSETKDSELKQVVYASGVNSFDKSQIKKVVAAYEKDGLDGARKAIAKSDSKGSGVAAVIIGLLVVSGIGGLGYILIRRRNNLF